jgi:hypothetical protein
MESRINDVVAWAARQDRSDGDDPAALLARFAAEQRFDALEELICQLRAIK